MNLTTENIISTLADAGQPMPSRAIANALGVEHLGKVRAMLTNLVHDELIERAKHGRYQLRDTMVHDVPTRSANVRREILPTDKVAIQASDRAREKRKAMTWQDKIDNGGAIPAKTAIKRKDSPHKAKTEPAPLPGPPWEDLMPNVPPWEDSPLPNGTIPVDKSVPDNSRPVDNPVMSKSVIKRLAAQKPVTTLEEIEAKVDEEKARDQRIREAVERLKRKADCNYAPVNNLEFKIEILDGIGSTDADLWDVLKSVISDLRRLDVLTGVRGE